MNKRSSNPSARGGYKRTTRKVYHRKKVCRFCSKKDIKINYKDAGALKQYITEKGKIIPRRITGTCAKHQRELCTAIKRARSIALLPFSAVLF